MVEIVLSLCLIGNAKICKDVPLTFMEQHITPHQCFLYGQAEIAKYLQSHPRWQVKKWKCGRPSVLAKA